MALQVNFETDEQEKLLATVASHLHQSVAPQAAAIDRETSALETALQELGKLDLLTLRVPKIWQGKEFNALNYGRFQEIIARYSGALAFLQTQHQSAASFLAKSNNQGLKCEYLPYMGRGKKLVGVGFSHLRRQGKPPVTATVVEGGYLINGEVPWVTGYGFFANFIMGARLDDGQELYAIMPLTTTNQSETGKIVCSETMQLAVMESTNTVKVNIHNWFIPDSLVLFIKPINSMHTTGKKNVLYHSFFALGCAQAGLDILNRNYEQKLLTELHTAYLNLNQQLTNCRQAIYQSLYSEEMAFESKLSLRVQAINLAGRCSQAAVVSSSGAANSKFHPAQRVYREALMCTVGGQTTEIMTETLQFLVTS